jgi:hypothetical protein
MNVPNKLESYLELGWKGLSGSNTLAWSNFEFIKLILFLKIHLGGGLAQSSQTLGS